MCVKGSIYPNFTKTTTTKITEPILSLTFSRISPYRLPTDRFKIPVSHAFLCHNSDWHGMGPNAELTWQKGLKGSLLSLSFGLHSESSQQNQVNKRVKCVLSIKVLLLCFICTNLSADIFVQSEFIRHKQPMYSCTDISWS